MAHTTTALNPKVPVPSPALRVDFATEVDLLVASTTLDWAMVKLLDSDVEATTQESDNWTPLHWACFLTNSSAIDEYLCNECVNARDSMGWTPLFWAAFNGDMTTVRWLLHYHSDHMTRDVNGWTALKWAMAMQYTEIAQILLKHHENCLQKLSKQPKAMLKELDFQQASQFSRKNDILQDMLATYPDGPHAGNKYKELCRLLVDADLRLAGLDNLWPPGHFDEPIGNIWTTESKSEIGNGIDYYLTEFSWRPKLESGRDWKSRLLHTAIRDDNLQAVRLLLELGADVNYRLGGTRPALFAAAHRKNPAYVKILLEHGANPSTRDNKKQTPLQLAVSNGFEETSAALISGGADVNEHFAGEVKVDGDGRPLLPHDRDRIAANKTPLMLACGLITPKTDPELKTRIVRLLLSNGADVAMKDRGGSSVIHYAARTRTFDIIKMVIDAGADGTDLDNFGRNALHHFCLGYSPTKRGPAAENSALLEMMRCLDLFLKRCSLNVLSECAKWHCDERWDCTTSCGKDIIHTPMSLAITRGWDRPDWDLFRWLHESESILYTSHRLDTLLDLAVTDVQHAAVRLLVRSSAKLHPDTQRLRGWFSSRNSPLTEYDVDKVSSILTDILPLGLDINYADSAGRTVLHRAAANTDSKRLPGILMRAGADPRKEDAEGLDAFAHACLGGNYETLRGLLAANHPRKRGGHWTQALSVANMPQGAAALPAVCAAMIDARDLATRGTASILCHAVKAGADEMVKILLALGSDPNIKGEDGQRPLHFAAEKGNTKLVTLLVIKGADLNAQDAHGRCALHLAALNNHADTVRYLLLAGCDADATDADGWRAIHYAAWKGDAEAVRSLVQAGADVHAATRSWRSTPEGEWDRPSGLYQDNEWKGTALHLAAMAASAPIVSMLLEAGVDEDASSTEDTYGGPTALQVVMEFYGRRGKALKDRDRLDVARLLVEATAVVAGVADRFGLEDVLGFGGHQELWDRLRGGISGDKDGRSRCLQSCFC